MHSRTNRWLALFTILGGAVVAVGLTASGCGGSVDDPATTTTTDTGAPDTGSLVVVDSAKPDTGTTMSDSEMMYDVPGSLFDATIPDVVFEGGKTAGGCYGCALTSCKTEAEECDKDPRCRGLFLCVVSDCAASFTDLTCALGCAGRFGVTGLGDPVVGKVRTLGTCVQNKCSMECPSAPETGASDAPKEASADAPSDTKTDGMAFMIFPGGAQKMQSLDPKLGELLLSISRTFNNNAAARDELIEKFSH